MPWQYPVGLDTGWESIVRNCCRVRLVLDLYSDKPVLVSYCSCNKLVQTQWVKQQILSYSYGGQSPSTKVSAGLHSFRGSREDSFPRLLQLPEAACVPWLMTPSSVLKVSSTAFSNFSFSDLCLHGSLPSLILTLLSPS